MLEPGDKIPDFTLPDQTGKEQRLSDLAGRKGLIIYVYPKDNTPGCTTEALEFSAQLTKLRRQGFNAVGLSKDSVKSHGSFTAKQGLKVSLLSDPAGELIQALGAWGEKKMRGRVYEGIIRSTFVVDPAGQVLLAYPKVKAKGHAAQLSEDIRGLAQG